MCYFSPVWSTGNSHLHNDIKWCSFFHSFLKLAIQRGWKQQKPSIKFAQESNTLKHCGSSCKILLCYLVNGLLNFLLLITDFSSDLFLTSFTSQNRLCRNMREQLFSVLADYSLEEQKDQVYYFKLMIISYILQNTITKNRSFFFLFIELTGSISSSCVRMNVRSFLLSW